MKASGMKKTNILDINGEPYVVVDIEVKSPSARGGATLYKAKLKNVVNSQSLQQTFRGDDNVDEYPCHKSKLQYLYKDGESAHFMDLESYAQYEVGEEDVKEQLLFLKDGQEGITGYVADDRLLTVELPSTVVLKIVECPPSMKAASASARTKPATMETGVIVQVPEYVEEGTVVIVNTETKEFGGRA